MAGQGHVLKTLINSLDNDRLHHAYLFTGTRGVGKTTIARILARCLNCETGITSEPCGKCSACTEIDEGRFIDLIEVDAASRTKVEDTRELLDNVQYSPSRGRFKVYLIDEVHMLSGHSFNALLKTLEEPPPHVKFLLATTDPQKLPVTVLSRCLQFNLKNISPERLVEHIKHILGEEKISFEEPALWQLGRAAQGSVRDCLTLLDQAIGFCEGNITDKEVRSFLGTIDQGVIHELVDALVAQDAAVLLSTIEAAADNAPDFTAVLADLQSYLHRVAIAQAVPNGIDNSNGDRERVKAHSEQIPAETLQLYYQVALKSREDMPYAIDARSGLEMALLRMLAFTPAGVPVLPESAPESEKKKTQLNEIAAAAVTTTATGEASSVPENITEVTEAPVVVKSTPKNKKPEPEAVLHENTDEQEHPGELIPEAEPAAEVLVEESVENSADTGIPASGAATGAATGEKDAANVEPALLREPIALKGLDQDSWIPLFFQLGLDGITRSIAANCLVGGVKDKQVKLILDESQTSVFNEEQQRRINAAFNTYFDEEISLEIQPGNIDAETPALWQQRMDQERLQEAIQTFENDTMVQEIVDRFSGSIQPDSIEPTKPKQY